MSCATDGFFAMTRVFHLVGISAIGEGALHNPPSRAPRMRAPIQVSRVFTMARSKAIARFPPRCIRVRRSACMAGGVFPGRYRKGRASSSNTPAKSSAGTGGAAIPHDPIPTHRSLSIVDEDRVIDANVGGGNSARWINHSCDPNCFADEGWLHLHHRAPQDQRPATELNYDYGLSSASQLTLHQS